MYTYTNLSDARIVISNSNTTDRNGNKLYDNNFVTWARRVIEWFNYLYKVARDHKAKGMAWGKCLAKGWASAKRKTVTRAKGAVYNAAEDILYLTDTADYVPTIRPKTRMTFSRAVICFGKRT